MTSGREKPDVDWADVDWVEVDWVDVDWVDVDWADVDWADVDWALPSKNMRIHRRGAECAEKLRPMQNA
jgi:hypothetical protein